ncbi:MAG: hypothetical protein LBP40_02175 [Campylobacteraceae bacterium]|jgi:hypothetical protein|nr:hypothetical protein [Campylobacteraceae bacterium]
MSASVSNALMYRRTAFELQTNSIISSIFKFKALVKTLIALRLISTFAFSANTAQEAFDRGVAAYERGDLQEAIK